MARPLKPLVRGGGYYPSNGWTPLVYAGGYTTANGGEEPAPPPIEKTVSGNPIHITDALAKPVQALSVAIEPIQDLHGYDNPWPAGGGKNKFNVADETLVNLGITFTSSNNVLTCNGTADSGTYPNKIFTLTEEIPAGTHTVSFVRNDGGKTRATIRIRYKDGTTYRMGNGVTATLTHESPITGFQLATDGGSEYATTISNIQIESGSTATTYAPFSNICPISGWTEAKVTRTGVNVWDEEWEPGIYSASDGSPIVNNNRIRSKNPIPVKPNTSYYFYCGNSDIGIIVHYFNASGEQIQTATPQNSVFTTPSNTAYIKFNTSTADLTTYNNDISINYPSTDTAYEPYQGETYSITFPSSAGTVYGGTLDVTTGKLTVTKAYALLNDPTGWRASTGTVDFTYYAGEFTNRKKYDNSYDGLVCSYMDVNRAGQNTLTARWTGSTSNIFGLRWVDGSLDQVKADASAGKIAICYELATPIVYDLTPTEVSALLGTNNIWSDSNGDLTLTYLADGNASDVEALNILLGGRYVNNHGENEPTDREALDILLGGTR